jgi:hypothetical protein
MWWFGIKNTILALTMGFDVLYDLFIISLNFTLAEQLTFGHMID